MKTFLATAAILTALAFPAHAEGTDPSTKAGEAKGNVKATTEMNKDVPGNASMNKGTTGSSMTTPATPNKLNKEETSSPANPGQKTGVSGGSGN